MNIRHHLIIKRGDSPIGFIQLNPSHIENARYIELSQSNNAFETFDLAKTDLLSVESNKEVVTVKMFDEASQYIDATTYSLMEHFDEKMEAVIEDEHYISLIKMISDLMDNPKGMNEKEKQKHTEMLRVATSDEKAKNYVISKMSQDLLLSGKVTEDELETMTYRIFGDLYGMGVLQELDDDPHMGEIMVNAVTFPKFQCDIYYIKKGEKYRYDKTFANLDEMMKVFQRTVQFNNKEINRSTNAAIECTRPNRDRVNIIVPDASDNYLMNIRKFTNFVPNLDMMKKSGTVDENLDNLMSLLVRGKANIGIGGAMGTGKTSYINYLLSYTQPLERKVVIASVSETDIDRVLKGHDVGIFNVNDEANFTFQGHLRTSLRTTADRVIIPESRGGEFKELYEANLKTKGNMFTAHALDDESFMDMCVDMYLSSPDVNGNESAEFLKNKITKALDVVIIMRRVGNKIRSKSVSEVLQDEKGNYAGMNQLYVWKVDAEDPLKGEYVSTGNKLSDKFKDRLNEHGITRKELNSY